MNNKYFICNDGPSYLHDFFDGWIYTKHRNNFIIFALLQSEFDHPFWNRRQLLKEYGLESVRADFDTDEWPKGAHSISKKECDSIMKKWKSISMKIGL